MKTIIETSEAPQPIGPYSQAVMVNGFLFASGQIAINPTSGEMVMDNIEKETVQVMENVGRVLAQAGMDYSHIIKSSIFIKDMNQFGQINEVYANYFSDDYPARETVEVARLPKDVNVEISVTAFKG